MKIKLDADANALYIAFREGTVERTIEMAEMVFAALDDGEPIGLEFVNADDFVPFMRGHAGGANVPPQLRELLGAAS